VPSEAPVEIVNIGFLTSRQNLIPEFRLYVLGFNVSPLREEGDTCRKTECEETPKDRDF
jgi:hypothetical protein